MNIMVESEQEIVREGLDVLMKNLPLSKVARLLSIWRIGHGDYKNERHKIFAGKTAASLFAKACVHEKRRRKCCA